MNKNDKIPVKSNESIRKAINNINRTPSEKYRIEPETVEKESLLSELFRIKFDFHRLKKVKENANRLNRYQRKIESRKKVRLRENLRVGEQVLVLAERLRKKRAPGKF